MIRRLRYQFILVTMACISFIFILILSVINISMTISSRNQGYALLHRISESPENPDKEFPKEMKNKEKHTEPIGKFDEFRIFHVVYNNSGKSEEVFYNENSDLTKEEILTLTEKVMENPKKQGVISKYLYVIKNIDDGYELFFLDYSMEKSMSLRLFWTCLFIGLTGILFIFILVIFLSSFMVKPVQATFDKQKQFIADASHELKTPLTIIMTNAEVLAGEIGRNKWLNHILSQTKRMDTLIKNLLELAKLDSYEQASGFTEFNMSTSIKNAALSLESAAYEYDKKYEIDIEDNITINGNENSIKELTVILLDNAFKFCDKKGTIKVHLSLHGEKKLLAVENTGKGITKEEQSLIFERFYRSDASRSRESGGYGLGLSIASSIVETHKGSITVKSDGQHYTLFTVILP